MKNPAMWGRPTHPLEDGPGKDVFPFDHRHDRAMSGVDACGSSVPQLTVFKVHRVLCRLLYSERLPLEPLDVVFSSRCCWGYCGKRLGRFAGHIGSLSIFRLGSACGITSVACV
jgi:hypothetical protein